MTSFPNTSPNETKEERLILFQYCCDKIVREFKEISLKGGEKTKEKSASNFLNKILGQLESKKLIDKVEFVIDKNSAQLINDNYWFMLENIAKKILSVGKNGEKIFADIYKILSITEFSVIATSPVVLEYSGNEEDLEDKEINKLLTVVERLVNGYFAWTCAFEALSRWDSLEDLTKYEDLKSQKLIDKIWYDVMFHIEDIEERENALTVFVEHLRVISNSSAVNFPIWTNSMWWRLLLLHVQHRVNSEIKILQNK